MKVYEVTFSEGHTADNTYRVYVEADSRPKAFDSAFSLLNKLFNVTGMPYFFIKESIKPRGIDRELPYIISDVI